MFQILRAILVSLIAQLMLAFIMHHVSQAPLFTVRIRGTHMQEAVDVSPPRSGLERGGSRGRRRRSRAKPPVIVREPEDLTYESSSSSSSSSDSNDETEDDDDDDSRTVVGSPVTARARPREMWRPLDPGGRNIERVSVTDFDFSIDLSSQHLATPEHFVLHDSLAAYRGLSSLEVDTPRRPASALDKARLANLQSHSRGHHRGRAERDPWQLRNCGGTRPLSAWVADYVSSNAALKEFVFTRLVHGWDLRSLETSIRATISESYTGTVDVSFVPTGGSSIVVKYQRPASPWLALFQRAFSVHRFGVCGAAYAFKRWVHLTDSLPGEDVAGFIKRTGRFSPAPESGRLKRTEDGISELVGINEEDWLATWTGTIRRCVQNRLRTRDALRNPIPDV